MDWHLIERILENNFMVDANRFITTDDALLPKRRGFSDRIAWQTGDALFHHE